LAFAQFLIDYKVQPLAVEIMLYHPYDGYAGALDLVCTLELEEKGFYGDTYLSGEKKGQPKESKKSFRRMAVIDLKSGKKGFYQSYEIQLNAYREMWNFHFPELPIEKIMNFAPKDWRGSPSYSLKDQTDSKNIGKLKSLVELNRIEESKRENRLTIISGKINLEKGLSDNVHEYTLTELIKQKYEAAQKIVKSTDIDEIAKEMRVTNAPPQYSNEELNELGSEALHKFMRLTKQTKEDENKEETES
jgi:hypothetical protein